MRRDRWKDFAMTRLRDGKTWRRRHARAKGQAPLHLVSAFAATRRRVLGQAADEGKTNQRTAIPARRDRWAEKDGLKGAIVAIDAIATHPGIAGAIRAAGAADRRAVKANQPTPALRSRACSRRPIRKVSPSPSISPRATALRHQPPARRRGQTKHRTQAKTGRMGPRISRSRRGPLPR